MHILIIEPYFTGSHAQWALGYQKHSKHTVSILKLSGNFWKWRMHGGAVTLARKYLEQHLQPDLILATDMLDLTTFLSLTRAHTASIPVAVYFHENQITYPWSPRDRDLQHKRDKHYGFINYATALTADHVLFNSHYHQDMFIQALPKLLKGFPDHTELASVETIQQKSQVLHLGLALTPLDCALEETWPRPLILWNHRWEHDKNPEEFFAVLYTLADKGYTFDVAILGENFSQSPAIFNEARKRLGSRIVHFGFAQDFETYATWLQRADILPVTSYQDNFGISIAEAAFCQCIPLLPKRLAYPEVIPYTTYPHCFYTDTQDLTEKLAQMLTTFPHTHKETMRDAVAHYAWEQMAPVYDALLRTMKY